VFHHLETPRSLNAKEIPIKRSTSHVVVALASGVVLLPLPVVLQLLLPL
jgi:hypothetical protein